MTSEHPEDQAPEEMVSEGGSTTEAAGDEPAAPAEPDLQTQLTERTADLQRLQAEYVNYKRRVDRDRQLVRAQGETAVLQSLLTVLDDIGRAAEHGELSGGFKAVADSLQAAVTKHGLEAYGAQGDRFDPAVHEAVFHAGESADVDATTVDTVMRTGYKVGDRVLRAATVGVVDPAGETPDEAEPADEPADDETK